MRENAATKARRYLTEGRLIVTYVNRDRVRAVCRGDGAVHRLGFEHGTWTCTCEVRTDACSHLRALRHVVAIDLKANP